MFLELLRHGREIFSYMLQKYKKPKHQRVFLKKERMGGIEEMLIFAATN